MGDISSVLSPKGFPTEKLFKTTVVSSSYFIDERVDKECAIYCATKLDVCNMMCNNHVSKDN
jgi:hypothetical protein